MYSFRRSDHYPVKANFSQICRKIQVTNATGLLYFNARYYDPQLGTFLSPDAIVPDPAAVPDYNRFLYARGNPLKYTDPSGHYSNEEIMQHFGCEDWACVESNFQDDGAYAGMWGWLYILQKAVDGDLITAMQHAGSNGWSTWTGMFQRSENGRIGIIPFELKTDTEIFSYSSSDPVDNRPFALYGATGDMGFYALNSGQIGTTPSEHPVDCTTMDCVAVSIDVVSAGGAALQVPSPICGPYAPACTMGGWAISSTATIAGIGWTAYQVQQSNASGNDLVFTSSLGAIGILSSNPQISLTVSLIQLGRDATTPLFAK